MNAWLLMFALGLVFFAGCSSKELEVHTTTIDYDGGESGDHEKMGTCDKDGILSGNGHIDDGKVRIVLTDAGDHQVYDRTFDGDFSFTSEGVTGQEGQWKLKAERTGDDLIGDQFKGKYSFTLTC